METTTPPPIEDAYRTWAAAGELVGPDWAAWFLGVPPETLVDWRRSRVGPPVRRCGWSCWRYAIADLIRWREARGLSG
jgi:hypothetical protein